MNNRNDKSLALTAIRRITAPIFMCLFAIAVAAGCASTKVTDR